MNDSISSKLLDKDLHYPIYLKNQNLISWNSPFGKGSIALLANVVIPRRYLQGIVIHLARTP